MQTLIDIYILSDNIKINLKFKMKYLIVKQIKTDRNLIVLIRRSLDCESLDVYDRNDESERTYPEK